MNSGDPNKKIVMKIKYSYINSLNAEVSLIKSYFIDFNIFILGIGFNNNRRF